VGVRLEDEQIKEKIRAVDKDNNGMIEFDEFVSIMASNMLRDGGGDAELDQAFRLFDQDGDGYVDLSEARKYLSNCGSRPLENEEMEEFFASLEIDGQDRISIDAFKAMACWQVPSPKQMEQAETASRLGGSSSTVTVGSVHGHALNRKSGRLDHPSSPAKQISPAKQPSQLGQAR